MVRCTGPCLAPQGVVCRRWDRTGGYEMVRCTGPCLAPQGVVCRRWDRTGGYEMVRCTGPCLAPQCLLKVAQDLRIWNGPLHWAMLGSLRVQSVEGGTGLEDNIMGWSLWRCPFKCVHTDRFSEARRYSIVVNTGIDRHRRPISYPHLIGFALDHCGVALLRGRILTWNLFS